MIIIIVDFQASANIFNGHSYFNVDFHRIGHLPCVLGAYHV